MLTSCLPATGVDNWTIMLLVVIAGVLLAAGVIAVKRSSGRVALAIAPLAILGLVIAAPAAPAQAVEEAYAGFTIEGWTADFGGEGPDDDVYLSDPATADQEATLQALQDMVVEGSATKTLVSMTLTSSFDGSVYTFEAPEPWFDFGTDFQIAVYYDAVQEAIAILDEGEGDAGDFPVLELEFVYDYVDSCDRPLQTVIIYSGPIDNAPVP